MLIRNLDEGVGIALDALRSNKLRSTLTILGVVHDGTRPMLQVRRRAWRGVAGDSVVASVPIAVTWRTPIYLEIRARNDRYDFLYATKPNAWKTLVAGADGTILSVKIGGGFVGSMFGLYAYSGSESK